MKQFFFECVPVFIERAPGVTVGAALVAALLFLASPKDVWQAF